ncbi:hypothetical protein GPECTOR_21g693 [Gonium pectorale]|uniref:FAST kinase leucine-rich domain-containing protein n=1 Tax=Gonium pectorale TaxID=33097 RepID=A0A150GI30_GONPE|nr:hypothetical protein GPECTOR_21g693 [Gonium pectorale]|eukprot:KXZ49467.1 hypothetical protein GPECTOR_21g693 [Gonium pectorale]
MHPARLPRPLPARVLANGVWAAGKLLLLLWPRPQEAASGRSGGGLGLHSAPSSSSAGQADGGLARGSIGTVALRGRAAAALRTLLASVPEGAAGLDPQNVSNLLYTLARLSERAPDVLAPVRGGTNAAAAALDAGGAKGPSHPAGSEAVRVEELALVVLRESSWKLAQFGSQALSNSLYALAVLGISPPRAWMASWLSAAASQLPLADPQHIANMLWALAKVEYHPGEDWVLAALRAAALKMPAFTTQGICNALWALAKLGYVPDSPVRARALLPLLTGLRLAALLNRLEQLAELGELEAAALATALQSMARMGLRPDGLVAGWTERVVGNHLAAATGLRSASRPGGRQTWGGRAAAPRRGPPEEGIDESAAGGERRAAGRRYDARAARMLLWSLARLGCPVSDDTAGVLALAAVARGACDGGASSGSVGRDRAAASGGALEQAHSDCEREALMSQARDVGLALWALSRVLKRPSREVMRQLVRYSFEALPAARPTDLLGILRAFAELGFRPGAPFWLAVEARVVQLAGSLSDEQVRLLLAACHSLRHPVNDCVLAVLGRD